jgi:hypoxanthine phosphoribosyltransferase
MSKLYYSWQSFDEDMKIIADYVKAWGRTPYFVGLHRGSLPMAVKLSNHFGTPMSIIKFQSRDGEDKEAQWVLNEIPSKFATVIVLDDILDTGKTLGKVNKLMTDYQNVIYMTIYNNTRAKKEDINIKVSNLRVSNGEWIVFPWEEA